MDKENELTSEELEALACPLDPKWAAKMISLIGPRGKLGSLARCPSVKQELKKIQVEMGIKA